jgi:hypothetical protein
MKEAGEEHRADRVTLPLVRVAEVLVTELHGPAGASSPDRDFSALAGTLRLRLPDAVAQALWDGRAGARMALLLSVSPFGLPVICAAIQSGATQVRAVLNWDDQRVQLWLSRVLRFERVQLCIDAEKAGLPVWMGVDLIDAEMTAVRMARQRAADLPAALATVEMSEAAAQLATPEAVPTLIEGRAIEALVIAVVRPCERQAGVRAGEPSVTS